MKAYVLIEVASVVKTMRETKGIESADVVTGLYDVIAIARAPDSIAIGKIVTDSIHAMDGVVHTFTCFAVEIE